MKFWTCALKSAVNSRKRADVTELSSVIITTEFISRLMTNYPFGVFFLVKMTFFVILIL